MSTQPVRPRHPHTAVKHELLVRYLDVWTPTVLRSARRAAYAEGYAGSDLDPAEGWAGGSPVAALRAFGEFADHMAGRRLDMVLVEQDPDRLRALAGRLAAVRAELGDPAELEVHTAPGGCAQLVPALRRAGALGGPVLAYLDSAGDGAAAGGGSPAGAGSPAGEPPPFETVAAVAGHRSSEVLVSLDPGLLAGLAAGALPAEAGDRLFGDGGWRAVTGLPRDRRYPYLVDRYRAALRGAGLGLALHVELVADDGSAQLLVFGTGSRKNLERLKDELWAVDEYAGVRYRDPRDGEQALLDISLRPYLGPLRRALRDAVAGHGERTVAQLRQYAVEETLYRAADATRALTELLGSGALDRHPADGRLSADTAIRPPAAAGG
jgi:hypothetical protein